METGWTRLDASSQGRRRAGRVRGILAVAGAVAALAVVGCGGGDGDGQHASTTATQGSTALGRPNPAKGEPIRFGSINMEGGAASFPFVRQAMLAATRYVNAYLGGVHGRPLQLDFCISPGDPGASINCANRLIADRPVAVLSGLDLGAPGSMPVVERAGLAWIGSWPTSNADFASRNAVQFFPSGRDIFAANAAYAVKVLHAHSAAIIAYSIPAAQQAADAAEATFKAMGVTDVKRVSVAIANPDRAPAVAAATADKPDVLLATEAGPTCVSLMQAVRQLAPDTKLMTAGDCLDARTLSAAGPAAEGVLFADGFDPLTADTRSTRLFEAAMKRFAPADTVVTSATKAGFSAVINTWSALNSIPDGELSTATILRAFRSGSDHPNFLSHPYTCTGRVKDAPAACNGASRIIVVEDGQPKLADDAWYDATQFIQ